MEPMLESDYRVVNIIYRTPPKGLDFGLDDSMRIVFMEATALLGHLFCVNDQVLFVNGISPASPAEAMTLMERKDIEIIAAVLRSEYVEPVSLERTKSIQLQRRKGYCYFVAKLKTTETNKKMGLSIRQVNGNVYVAQVPKDGLAHGILMPGDFLLDIDGIKCKTFSVPAIKRQITQKLTTAGECTMVIERAENYDTRVMTLNALKLKPMPRKVDPELPADASTIGSRQAEYHYRHNRKSHVTPKSILKAAEGLQLNLQATKSPRKKKGATYDTTTGATTGRTTTGDEDGGEPNVYAIAGTTEINAIEEDIEDAPRRVSFTSSNPEVHAIGTDYDGSKPLQKVVNRQKPPAGSPQKAVSDSIISITPTRNGSVLQRVSSPAKVSPSKCSPNQTPSQYESTKRSTRRKPSK